MASCRIFAPLCWAWWAACLGTSLTGPRTQFTAGTSAQGGLVMPHSAALVLLRRLTLRGLSGMVEVPNQVRRRKRLPDFPRVGRSLAAQSAFAVKAPAGRLSGGLLAHIGRVATSRTREGWRLHLSRGALRPAFFCSLNQVRYPMFSPSPAASRPALVALSRNRIPAREVAHV